MQHEQFDITGMTCSACAARIEKVVKKIPGVDEANVNLLKNTMRATFDPIQANSATIMTAVEKAGYGISIHSNERAKAEANLVDDAVTEVDNMRRRLILSLTFSLPLIYLSMGGLLGLPIPDFLTENPLVFSFTQFLLVIPIIPNTKWFSVVNQ